MYRCTVASVGLRNNVGNCSWEVHCYCYIVISDATRTETYYCYSWWRRRSLLLPRTQPVKTAVHPLIAAGTLSTQHRSSSLHYRENIVNTSTPRYDPHRRMYIYLRGYHLSTMILSFPSRVTISSTHLHHPYYHHAIQVPLKPGIINQRNGTLSHLCIGVS